MKYTKVEEKEICYQNWKNKNNEYIFELEKFIDKASNIKEESLRKEVIFQMLQCDNELTKIAENMFDTIFLKGYKKGYKKGCLGINSGKDEKIMIL